MTAAYKGRHSGEDNRETPAAGQVRSTVNGFSHIIRRPLVSAAVILAVAGISAAGSSEATTIASGPSYMPSPMAMAQSAELTHNRDDTNVALAAARRSGVLRAAALTHYQKVAADSRAKAAVALTRERAQSRDRAAREKQRQALVDRAQSDPKSIGRLLASDRGWGDGEFSCLDSLWTKESGWSWSANNGSSGAYGIPQSLPGSKMASAGSDWQTNPVTQIKWGLQYIANSYGTPCSAWGHSQAMNWY
jgi:hypothetical protein